MLLIKLFYWKNSKIFSSCIDVIILHFGAVCHSRTWACMQGHISEIQFFQKRCKCPMLNNMSSKNQLGGMNLKVQGLIKRQDGWPKDLVIVRPQNLKNTFDEYYYFFCSHTAFDEYYYFFCSHTAFINSVLRLNIKIVDQDMSNWWPITDIACHSALMRIPYT